MPSFNRLELLRATENAIVQHRAAWGRRQAKRAAAHAKEVADWTKEHADTWKSFGRLVARKIGRGDPIRAEDLPGGGRHYLPTFSGKDPATEEYTVPESLTVLATTLHLLTDEKISAASLRDLGVRADTLHHALQLMPRNTP